MNRKIFKSILSLVLVILTTLSKAQETRIDSINILHYELHVNLTNLAGKQLSGEARIVATSNFLNLNTAVLDLQKLVVQTARCNGRSITFSQTDSTIRLNLDTFYQPLDTFELNIQYSGTPVLDGRWGGFYFTGDYAFNMGVGMASNPPNFGRCWFPCNDNFTDRATYSFHIETDSGYMAVCSGMQEPATPKPGGTIIWNWRLNQEIPTYIANVAVSKYVLLEWNFTSNNSRVIPVIIAVNPLDTAKAMASFARLNQALQCFESKFGPYLFERVGYVAVPFNSGAMEHCGNISYPIYAIDGSSNFETLMAHELSHHWWGNLVTTRLASEMWLNEGWASYCEALFLECIYGKVSYQKKIADELFESLRWAHVKDGGFLPVSGVPLAKTYGTHVYTKGGLIAHSLRTTMGDSAFFLACKEYLANFKYRDATTFNLKEYMVTHSNQNLLQFFDVWVYEPGDIDLQLIEFKKQTAGKYKLITQTMRRHKSNIPDKLQVNLTIHYSDATHFDIPVIIRHNWDGSAATDVDFIVGHGKEIAYVTINDDHGLALAKTFDREMQTSKGLKFPPNSLLTYTINQLKDSARIHTEHHFAGPWFDPKDQPAGIRVSKERYWHINGIWDTSFRATAFFNYDGATPTNKTSGFLDNELIQSNEDSLVLLYRPNALSPFQAETDLTFQSGSNKTDKTGRFWVNQLKKGDYVFGYRDITAGIKATREISRELNLFPNPTDGCIQIELPNQHPNACITVYDSNGRIVQEKLVENHERLIQIQTNTWIPGTYFLIYADAYGTLSKTFILK